MTPEILTGLSAAAGFIFRMAANSQANIQQERLANSKQFAEVEVSTAAARKHQGKFASITRTIMAIVLLGMIVFLLVVGINVPTNLVIEIPAGSFLGVFSWGASTEIITVKGLVAYPWLPKMVFIIIGFYFGQGSAKRL
jgi:hypothetical protein